ncbi:MAG: hypothetical protein GX224_00160 [Thermoplasmatales archaeon]|nr:hypothetical protein [Thermoplasmatales archaeon]
MKLSYTVPKLAIAAASVALGLVVLTSVLPLLSGGLAIDETEAGSGLQMEIEGVNMVIRGDYTVRSSLPYDINDAYLRITLGKPGGARMTVYDGEAFDVPKGGSAKVVINEEIFLPTVMMVAVANHDSGKLTIPATVSVGGVYLDRLTGLGVEVDMLIDVSNESGVAIEAGMVPTADGKDYQSFDIDVTVDVEELGGITIPMEDGVPIEAKFGDTTITLVKNGNSISLDGVSAGTGIIGDILGSEEIVVTGHDPITVTEEQKAELAEILSAYLAEYPDGIPLGDIPSLGGVL